MKTRLLAILVVSSLVLASVTSVAFAQDTDGGAGDDGRANLTIVDCSQVQNAFGNQGQYGNASAQYQSEAIAIVSQELNISQNQVNDCLGNIGADGDNNGDDRNNNGDDDSDTNTEDNKRDDDVLADTIPEADELPNTGGPSLLALGAGLALVAGGASLIGFGVRR